MFSDDVPTYTIKKYFLDGNYFTGDFLNGPIPTLFNDSPGPAISAMMAEKEKVNRSLNIKKVKFLPKRSFF